MWAVVRCLVFALLKKKSSALKLCRFSIAYRYIGEDGGINSARKRTGKDNEKKRTGKETEEEGKTGKEDTKGKRGKEERKQRLEAGSWTVDIAKVSFGVPLISTLPCLQPCRKQLQMRTSAWVLTSCEFIQKRSSKHPANREISIITKGMVRLFGSLAQETCGVVYFMWSGKTFLRLFVTLPRNKTIPGLQGGGW